MTNYRGNSDIELKWWELDFPLARSSACVYLHDLKKKKIVNLINSLSTYSELKMGDPPISL